MQTNKYRLEILLPANPFEFFGSNNIKRLFTNLARDYDNITCFIRISFNYRVRCDTGLFIR